MRLWPACLLWALGCAADATIWVPRPPIEAEAQSLVLLFMDGGRAEFGFAARLDSGAVDRSLSIDGTPWNAVRPERPEIKALFFAATLAELELEEGLIAGEGPHSCLLERPIAVHRVAAGEDQDKAWSRVEPILVEDERVVLVGELPCRRPNLCRRLRYHAIPLPSTVDTSELIALDDRSALVVIGGGETVVRVDQDRAVTSTVYRGLPTEAAFLTPERRLWLGGQDGAIAEGPVDGPFTRSQIPNLETFWVSAIDVDPRNGDVLALSIYQPGRLPDPPSPNHMIALHRRRGGGDWVELHRAETNRANGSAARIVRFGESRAAIVYRDESILLLDGDRASSRTIAEVGLLRPFIGSVARDDSGRVYFGGTDGQLYWDEHGNGEIRRVDDFMGLSASIDTIVPWGDGLFVAGSEGYLVEYNPKSAPCEYQVRATSDLEVMVRVGNALVGGGGTLDPNRPNQVTWVTVE